MSAPQPRVFTKDSPCTKLEVWQCFKAERGFKEVPIVAAHAIIGVNVPRVLEREARLLRYERSGVEYYRLTIDGEEWLNAGFRGYLRNHPAHVRLARYIPRSWFGANGRIKKQ